MSNYEILFKARTTDTKEFVESTAINRQIDMYGNKHTFLGVPVRDRYAQLQETVAWTEVDAHTVGRYTGMEDRNKIKIYEHDVIKQHDGKLFLVFWSDNYLQFRARDLSDNESFKNLCDFVPSLITVVGTQFGYTLTAVAED